MNVESIEISVPNVQAREEAVKMSVVGAELNVVMTLGQLW